jgi:hypothetical protein
LNDEDSGRLRLVLIGLGALLAVSILIGGVVSVLALGLADVAGVDGDTGEAAAPPAETSMFVPSPSASETPSPSASETPSPSASETPSPSATETPSPSATETPSPSPTETPSEPVESETPSPSATETPTESPRTEIVLTASPSSVSTFGRIDLQGAYRIAATGTTVQVQRFEGGWADFPTTATVEGGTFFTFVESGQTGPNRFRVVDTSTGEVSNPVTVNVG